MIVSAWLDGNGGTYGVRVGYKNRNDAFDHSWQQIEVEIDGEWHTFKLTPGFWNHCPEFRDSGAPVIRDWLRRNFEMPWAKGQPPHFILEFVSERRFRLKPEPAPAPAAGGIAKP